MARAIADTVFLVSGGARGVTAQCVIALARAHKSAFVLLGRTPVDATLPFPAGLGESALKSEIASYLRAKSEAATPVKIVAIYRAVTARDEITATLRAISDAGARAEYLPVDVTDPDALRAALSRSRLGRVTGIIHGAGVLSDRLIEDKTAFDFDRVYATKVHGLRAMLDCVEPRDLGYLALFSSVAGFRGNRGQADYAIANEVLNKFAHAFRQRVPACHTTVFDWGPWDGGMVTPQLRSLFTSRGVSILPVDRGARVFVDTLTDESRAVQLVVNDPGVIADATPWPAASRRISRSLRVEGNPFLRDHVIDGSPVLPAACAAVWIANACQQVRPGYRFFSLSGFKVLKGIVCGEGLAERYTLDMAERAVSEDGATYSVVISSASAGQKPRYHYRGEVSLVRAAQPTPRLRTIELASDGRIDNRPLYGDGALFHGPAFQAITRVVRVDARSICVECRRPDSAEGTLGQFPAVAFDPVWADTQYQCVGIWAQHVLRAAALPTSCERYEWFGAPPAGVPVYITATIDQQTAFNVRASISVHDSDGRVFAQTTGAELTLRQVASASHGAPPVAVIAEQPPTVIDPKGTMRLLRDLDTPCSVVRQGDGVMLARDSGRSAGSGEPLARVPAITPAQLGSPGFRQAHRVEYAYMAGAMAKGIASEDLVIALGRAGILGSYGAGGLTLDRIEQGIVRIQKALAGKPCAFNLLHSPKKLQTEDATVDLYLKHNVRTVEASSYMDLTPSIVRYRLAGLRRRDDGGVAIDNRVIVKLSRVELATRFMQPAPSAIVQQLLAAGRISPEQAALAPLVPIADDITVEADSGGHTDNRPLVAILPSMLRLRDQLQARHRWTEPIRIGAAGGIATPHSVLAAFTLGADYVVTGSINQSCVEAGTSAVVKRLLVEAAMTEVAMAPESDMFEQGVRVQVLKKGSLFPMRAQKLFECYQRYDSLEAIPQPVRQQLEQQVFKDSLDRIWSMTEDYLSAHKPHQLARAADDPKVKMALLFKWYMGQSSRWAVEGAADRVLDYQVWCGPAMGAFNEWARGTYLEAAENRRVADIARVLMSEAALLYRVQLLKVQGFGALAGVS
ncbi:MAG TPA: PfaD family polyunsaturated fatty acid/polyketide biosynthesis protein [Vicinamibacterales bacterium]|nr:PfaD family polyunsaturated fatty acid/polyketide biosynthesis protein [Vicinamibacterales bacterium]